jgi:hypothetical protein
MDKIFAFNAKSEFSNKNEEDKEFVNKNRKEKRKTLSDLLTKMQDSKENCEKFEYILE